MLCSPLGPSSWKPWPSLGLHRARPADQRFNLPHPSFPTQAPKTQNENWWLAAAEGGRREGASSVTHSPDHSIGPVALAERLCQFPHGNIGPRSGGYLGKRNMRLSHLAVACLASTALVLSMAGATAAPEDDVVSERADVGIVKTYYNDVDDDLLTAGLGKTGLGSAAAPAIANPTQPTVQELRRLAIYNNYRALIDPTPGGGYGTLYGPNIKADGTVTNDEGKIAGFEYIAYERAQDGNKRVTRMIQVPDSFN